MIPHLHAFKHWFPNNLAWLKKKWKAIKRLALGLLAGLLLFLLADLLFPLDAHIGYSPLVLAADGSLMNASLSDEEQWCMKTTAQEVDPKLIQCILYKEDRWFYYHPGVNLIAIARAIVQNTLHMRRMSGASTITMQVARMLQPGKRTFATKLREIFRSLQLELHYSKSQILDLYLNLLPYGGNIRGIKAACYLYLGQSAASLSEAQIAALVVIPNSPNLYRPGMQSEALLAKRNQWIERFTRKGIFSGREKEDALREPITTVRSAPPHKIPHLARLLTQRYPEDAIFHTYINPRYQDFVENLLSETMRSYRGLGIGNSAVIVLDNHRHTAIAYAGSASFDEAQYAGQVDGVQALRSPGSTLKPWLYSLCFDRGLITPLTMLEDIPRNYSGFRPQNFDETFRGRIPAAQALALSLNLPAVELANEYGVDEMKQKLAQAGLGWVAANQKKVGLSLILGGCGATLQELASLFEAFANNGNACGSRLCEEEAATRPIHLFSKEAAWMTTEILTGLHRPDLPEHFDNTANLPHIAWKTGTSYGRRDAWAIGFNPDYTVGVWVGNFDGRGVAELTGSDFATPVLFKIFNYLQYNQHPTWFVRPKNLDFRIVCTETGLPPGEKCSSLAMDDFIPAVSPNRKCNHLVQVMVSADSSMSYCHDCLPANNYRLKWYPQLSPSLISFYNEQQIPYQKIPPHNPACTHVYSDGRPTITSPDNGKEYLLVQGAGQQIQLSCSAQADAQKVFWYVDDHFVKACSPSEKVFITPGGGTLKVSCCDDKGRNSDVHIKVTFVAQ